MRISTLASSRKKQIPLWKLIFSKGGMTMTKRRWTIIKQKLAGVFVVMSAAPLANIMDGDLTLPIALISIGLILMGCNKTFGEIVNKMTDEEIQENQRDNEDL
jgi:hypothetical protein